MKNSRWMKVLLLLAVIIANILPSYSEVKVSEGNGVNITMENTAMKLNVAVEGGGRISSLVNKKSGKDIVALWKGLADEGGLLDDRNVFTAFPYQASVIQPGGKTGIVQLSSKHPSGISMTKRLILHDDSDVLEVSETLSNGTQKEVRFMIRNYMLPGGGPRTDDCQYFVPQKEKPIAPLTPASSYLGDLALPWAAIWNRQTGEGILTVVPGVNQFYFWQGSATSPTYEWIYPYVPAGKSITVNYAIRLINSLQAPDWTQLSMMDMKSLHEIQFAGIPGWQNEEHRFSIMDSERVRGFWLSTGDGEGKRRLPPLRIDAPLGQSRSVYIGINTLKDFAVGNLELSFKGLSNDLLETSWEVNTKDSIEVVSFKNKRDIELKSGTEGRLWLTLNAGTRALDDKGEIELSLNGEKVLLPFEIKVWPVQVPKMQPFSVHEYAGVTTFLGGYAITPASLQQADTLFKYFHAIGGNTMFWTLNWSNTYHFLKIQDSDQTLADWIKTNRETYLQKPASQWPKIDFSYYDDFVEAAKRNGITKALAYLPLSTEDKPVTVEQEWLLIHLKNYLQNKGMHGFFCKIGDEIAPEKIPDYIVSAKIAHRTGWRPFTTITGLIPRTTNYINQINPYLDLWELGLYSTQYFDSLIHRRYELQERTFTLSTDKWGIYNNGGAQNTVAQKLFGGIIPVARTEIQNLQIFQNGKELQSLGGSPWGNKQRGVFFGGSVYLYVSPFEGVDIETSNITMKYQVSVPSNSGKILAEMDPTDELWFYGGGSRPYRAPYGSAAAFPLLAIQGRYGGFGLYDFNRWNEAKILWYDKGSGKVSVSPVYLGYRDGWNDACLLAWLEKEKHIPLSRFISERIDSPLRVDEEAKEVFRWKNIVNITDPIVLNDARQKILEAAQRTD